MSEYDDLLPHEEAREGGIQYVDETGKPEDAPVLQTAADLLPPDDSPLAALPSEPPDDDTPPDDAAPTFIVTPMKGRPPSITLADGTPVGVWLQSEYPDADGGFVAEQLIVMGMDGDLAAWYGLQRDRAREATGQLMSNPVVAAFATEEERRAVEKKKIQDAFVEAQKKKG